MEVVAYRRPLTGTSNEWVDERPTKERYHPNHVQDANAADGNPVLLWGSAVPSKADRIVILNTDHYIKIEYNNLS